MSKNLFLLCPTDCLEETINIAFKQENYFYTSLGNSFDSDRETLKSIKELIENKNIGKIYFVLSNDNQIISDALKGQFFSRVRGLKKFYDEIMKWKEQSGLSWQTSDRKFAILSYYLNEKIKELRHNFYFGFNNNIEMKGQIYDRTKQTFKDIYPKFICVEKHLLN